MFKKLIWVHFLHVINMCGLLQVASPNMKSKYTYGEHVDKVNYVEMKHVSELAIIGLLLKPFKTWVVPGKPTVILTRTRGGMLEIELVRFMDLLPCQGIYM